MVWFRGVECNCPKNIYIYIYIHTPQQKWAMVTKSSEDK